MLSRPMLRAGKERKLSWEEGDVGLQCSLDKDFSKPQGSSESGMAPLSTSYWLEAATTRVVLLGYRIQYIRLGGLKNRSLFFHSSGGLKSKIKML